MKDYDETEPSKYIMYLNANNLYGCAMSQCLPAGDFRWLTPLDLYDLELFSYGVDSDKRLILEADLEYPEELHDLHND